MKSRGFTLIEMAVVLLIMGFITAMLFAGVRSATTSSKYKTTIQALQNADAALVNFVMLTRRLPCPANGSLPPGDPNVGKEIGACANPADQANGVVPWTTLGIPQVDVTDGFGSLITYRLFAPLAITDSLNFTACDPAGGRNTIATAPATPSGCVCPDPAVVPASSPAIPTDCTRPTAALAAKGLAVQGVTTSDPASTPATGAAYVLISHGPNLGLSYAAQGGFNAGVSTVGTNEGINGADKGVQASYYDSAIDMSDTNTHFDDILLHPSVSSVASRAGLGPRAHSP